MGIVMDGGNLLEDLSLTKNQISFFYISNNDGLMDLKNVNVLVALKPNMQMNYGVCQLHLAVSLAILRET